jgi:hypothetical protein
MTLHGKWRIVEMPDYDAEYPDMMESAYILFDGRGRGSFAFGCVTGRLRGADDTDAVEFAWEGNDEMDEASGEGWAELQPDRSLIGTICFNRGDEVSFTARRWVTSSTAC